MASRSRGVQEPGWEDQVRRVRVEQLALYLLTLLVPWLLVHLLQSLELSPQVLKPGSCVQSVIEADKPLK